jgi:hypothetical protein
MTPLLEQSTAVTLLIGPFLDEDDGKTAEGGLSIDQADVRLSKNAGNMAQKNDATSCTHDELGYYTCPLNATDTGTLGILKVMVHESGALPVWHEFMVVPSNVWDSLIGGTDYLDTEVAAMATGVITAASIASAAGNKIADHTWRRTAANIRASSDGDSLTFRSGLGLLSKFVNKLYRSGANLLITEENDTTTFGTQAMTTDSGADPITELDTT